MGSATSSPQTSACGVTLLQHRRALPDRAANIQDSPDPPVRRQPHVVHAGLVNFIEVVVALVEDPGAVIEDKARQVVAAIAAGLQVDVLAGRLRHMEVRIVMQATGVAFFGLGQAAFPELAIGRERVLQLLPGKLLLAAHDPLPARDRRTSVDFRRKPCVLVRIDDGGHAGLRGNAAHLAGDFGKPRPYREVAHLGHVLHVAGVLPSRGPGMLAGVSLFHICFPVFRR